MDAATSFALAVGAACTAALAVDLSVAVLRVGGGAIRRADAPWRLIIGSTLCVAVLVGPMRPAGAATPPPAVRLVDAGVSPDSIRGGPVPVPALSGEDASTSYRVERGDSLWRIAKATLIDRGLPADGRAVARLWPVIHDANRDVIGADPDLIRPGQELVIPDIAIEHHGGTRGA
jgi:nucleoid-associated protein YgaU